MQMRTVVFSDERVALAVNARFVCVWENRNPSAGFPERALPNVFPHRVSSTDSSELPIGTGHTNVTSIFATPDGDVLNAIPGYLDVEAFFDELRLAQAVRKLAFDREYKPKEGASRAYAGLHRAAARLWGDGVPGRAHEYLARQPMPFLGGSFGPKHFDKLIPSPG